MNISIVASRDVFDQALRDARQIGKSPGSDQLASMLNASLLSRVDDVWDGIEKALVEGFQFGKAKAQEFLESALTRADLLLSEAGSKAREIHDVLLKRLQSFIQSFIEGALARVPSTLKVGALQCPLTSVTTTQKVMVSGSLKVNLAEVFSITSNGEIMITAAYGAATPSR